MINRLMENKKSLNNGAEELLRKPNIELLLSQVESLGDNCEFGFVLRSLGNETGGLFRWAVTPIEKLLLYLENKVENIFEFNNLLPFAPTMVIDQNSGFSFHSKMQSKQDENGKLVFLLSSKERYQFYEEEKAKINYLTSKFWKQMRGEDRVIYVIKRNQGLSSNDIERLHKIIRGYSSNHLILVVENEPEHIGEKVDGLNYATISRFAPYVKADDASYYEWYEILKNLEIK